MEGCSDEAARATSSPPGIAAPDFCTRLGGCRHFSVTRYALRRSRFWSTEAVIDASTLFPSLGLLPSPVRVLPRCCGCVREEGAIMEMPLTTVGACRHGKALVFHGVLLLLDREGGQPGPDHEEGTHAESQQ